MYLTLQSSPWIDIANFFVIFFKFGGLQYDLSFFFWLYFSNAIESYTKTIPLTHKIAIVTSIKVHYSVLSLF